MSFQIIPAVDIKNGKCVRLIQGQKDKETVFGDDPGAMAAKWAACGAGLIHVIDLDGAFEKKPRNRDAVADIVARLKVPIQVGGGIRTPETIAMYLELGVSRVILGTEAIRNPALVQDASKAYPGRIVVGIDARKGRVAADGWTRTTQTEALDLARRYEDCGVAAIIFTDIQRDGMQTGVNVAETRRLAEAVSISVIASGGVATLEDLKTLIELEPAGISGVIIGRALYSGQIDLKEAIALTHF